MDVQVLIKFFTWLTVLNALIFAGSCLIVFFANDFVYKIHGKLFSVSRETCNTVIYAFMCGYELFILFFNLVPLTALFIIVANS